MKTFTIAMTFTGIYALLQCGYGQSSNSDHFDGSCFFNKEPGPTFFDHVKWMWEMETVEWPEWIDDPPQPAPPEYVTGERLRVAYINHATVLIQADSINILTDPIWSMRAGLVSWLGVKRVRAPGVKMEDLPKIHFILISHDHFDHFDIPTLKGLVQKDQPVIIAGFGVEKLLKSNGFSRVIALDWWQKYAQQALNLKITFVPALHSSGRMVFMNNKTLWGGFVIELPAGKIYFAGDTGFGDFIEAIKARFSNFRLTIFPIGNYEKRWFMKNQHMNPDDAVQAHRLLESKQSAGIHFGTFAEHPEQSVDAHEKDLRAALEKHNIAQSEFWILKFGEGKDVP